MLGERWGGGGQGAARHLRALNIGPVMASCQAPRQSGAAGAALQINLLCSNCSQSPCIAPGLQYLCCKCRSKLSPQHWRWDLARLLTAQGGLQPSSCRV